MCDGMNSLNARTSSIIALTVLIVVLSVSGGVHAQEITTTEHYFVEASVDDETPYLGQHVTYTVKFYVAYPTAEAPGYKAPEFSGFMNRYNPKRLEYSESARGHSYTVYQVSTILYPTVAGSQSIGPATMIVPEESCIDWPSSRNCPGAYLSPMERGGGDHRFEYTTRQLDLAVLPLPSGPPKSFSGGVGSFQVRASVDAHTLRVGEPVVLAVTVTGKGSKESFPDDVWPRINHWRILAGSHEAFPPSKQETGIETKTFSRVMIPQRAGNYTIPSMQFSYFDPQQEQYVTKSTAPIEVEILEGQSSADGGTFDPGERNRRLSVIRTNVVDVKPVPSKLKKPEEPVISSPLFWWAWTTPFAVLLMLVALKLLGILRKGPN